MKCRITLDEVIAHERETAKEQKSKYDECITRMRSDCLMCLHKCNEIAEYHEKIVERLEELKILKSLKNCSFMTIGKTVEQFEQEIRNKAIDDFAEKIIRYVDCGHLCSPTEIIWSDLAVVEMVKKIEEQLKVGDGE